MVNRNRKLLRKFIQYLGITTLLGLSAVFIAFGAIAFNANSTSLDERLLHAFLGKTFYSDVYVMSPEGDVKNLSPSKNGIYYQAHISRDGKKVVFYGNDSGPPRIWVADLEIGTTMPLTPASFSARHPVFSWDGKQIAFASGMAHEQELEQIELMHGNGRPPDGYALNIFVMDSDGRNLRQITTGKFQDQRPAFSPDGKTIVFVSNRSGGDRLWMVSVVDPKEPRPLQDEGFGYRPCYSPDGRKIYFFTENGGSHQLGFLNIEIGDRKIHLLNDFGEGNDRGPFVDYKGRNILMHSNRSGKWEIWEASLSNQVPRRIQVPFNEALHATISENGSIAFDVPRISETRKFLSTIQMQLKKAKKAVGIQ